MKQKVFVPAATLTVLTTAGGSVRVRDRAIAASARVTFMIISPTCLPNNEASWNDEASESGEGADLLVLSYQLTALDQPSTKPIS